MIFVFVWAYLIGNAVDFCAKYPKNCIGKHNAFIKKNTSTEIMPVYLAILFITVFFCVLCVSVYKIRKKYSTINQNDPEIEISNKDPAGQTGDKQADKIPTSLSETDVQPNEINMQSEQ